MQKTLATPQQLDSYLADIQYQLDTYNLVVEALKTYEGKALNKRLSNHLELVLPQYAYSFTKYLSWWRLQVWGGAPRMARMLELNMGYQTETETYQERILLERNGWIHGFKDTLKHTEYCRNHYDQLIKNFRAAEAAYEAQLKELGPMVYAAKADY